MSARQLRKNVPALAAIAGLAALAALVLVYVARHQRLRLPGDPLYTIEVAMPNGQALTPGQGQSATVAGVRVGEISRVRLRDGHALVELAIDRRRLPRADWRADARLLVRPRTPLQDMTVDIEPGHASAPRLPQGAVLDEARTTPPVNVDEILAGLDSDTRAWMQTMLQASGRGLRDRGAALREAFRASAPTFRAAREVSRTLAVRRTRLRRAVHNLRLLTSAVARDDGSVARLLEGGSRTFTALARRPDAVRATIAQLPPTLDAATRALHAAAPLAAATGPALRSLTPTARALPRALRQTDPLLVEGRPALRDVSALSRTAAPVVRQLRPALDELEGGTPDLTSTFSVLGRLMNELAYVPSGGDHGYLFWAAWFAHNLNSFQGGQDANGAFWRGNTVISCSAALNLPALVELLGPALSQLKPICPQVQGAP